MKFGHEDVLHKYKFNFIITCSEYSVWTDVLRTTLQLHVMLKNGVLLHLRMLPWAKSQGVVNSIVSAPDPSVYLNADLDPNTDPRSKTNAYPDPSQTLPSQKVDFDIKNIPMYFMKVICQQIYLLSTKVKKSILKCWKSGFFVNFQAPGSGSAFPTRIRIGIQESHSNADPKPKHR